MTNDDKYDTTQIGFNVIWHTCWSMVLSEMGKF